MNELIMPHNVGVKNALENMKEVLALYKKVIGNYRPLLDGERYLTDREVAQILKVSRRTLQEYRNDGVILYILLGGKVLYRESDIRLISDREKERAVSSSCAEGIKRRKTDDRLR